MATKTNDPCREKAGEDEPIFTLRAQDLTADLLVHLWADAQRFVAARIGEGWEQAHAVKMLRGRLDVFRPGDFVPECSDKNFDAYQCSIAMRAFPNRKLPD